MSPKNIKNTLTDYLQQAVIVINQKGYVIYCNDSASQFWQKDTTRLIDKNIKGKIFFDGLKWTGKKDFQELLKEGDLINNLLIESIDNQNRKIIVGYDTRFLSKEIQNISLWAQ